MQWQDHCGVKFLTESLLMRYGYANWEPDPSGGRGPKLPPNHGFLLVAEPGYASEWALFRVDLADYTRREGLTPITDELDGLLLSGEMYPPALALARDEVMEHFSGRVASHAEFDGFYRERLRHHLAAQDTAGYLMARCLRGQGIYLRKDSYYWLIDYMPEREAVRWVSSDYFVYTDPASDFEVTTQRLAQLPSGIK